MTTDHCDEDKDASTNHGLTRREFWAMAGLAGAAAGLSSTRALADAPAPAATSARSVSPVMERLSTYMSEASGRDPPAEVLEKTKQHLLDTLAAMLSGSRLPPGRAALQFSRAYGGGRNVATVAAADFLCGPIEAAFTNGMLAHSDETDDSHAPSQCHPGCAVVPAALATGERFGIDGAQLLRAVTLGYDIGPRFTMTLGGQAFEAGSHWSTHSIAPLFGAAAAAGCAAGLNARQMRWMLGY
ncbi:MAG TPA: MmgE/PrpD family protein, partial [Steroidobacteraceae bacterium]|nr:MmgE/PrpD family protein [Steroidobacteraceae bacterium]